jgi:hypothetical protein
MTFLTCSACGQRHFGREAARRRRRCALCGGPLRREPRPLSPLAASGGEAGGRQDSGRQARAARGGPPLPAEPPPLMRAASGSYGGGSGTYASLIDFAAADARRLTSRERDLGLVWRDGERLFRAALVEDTRELYVVQLGPAERGGGHVELLGTLAPDGDLDGMLEGWRDAARRRDSLRWLRAQLDAAAAFSWTRA